MEAPEDLGGGAEDSCYVSSRRTGGGSVPQRTRFFTRWVANRSPFVEKAHPENKKGWNVAAPPLPFLKTELLLQHGQEGVAFLFDLGHFLAELFYKLVAFVGAAHRFECHVPRGGIAIRPKADPRRLVEFLLRVF